MSMILFIWCDCDYRSHICVCMIGFHTHSVRLQCAIPKKKRSRIQKVSHRVNEPLIPNVTLEILWYFNTSEVDTNRILWKQQ